MSDRSRFVKRIVPGAVLLVLLLLIIAFALRGQLADSGSYTDDVISAEQGSQKQEESSVPVDAILKSAVTIESGGLRGSGNIWKIDEDSLIIITALHVIDDENDITVILPGGQQCSALVSHMDNERDYCLLQVGSDTIGKSNSVTFVKPAERLPETSESVYMVASEPGDEGSDGASSPASVSAGVVVNSQIYSEDLGQDVIYCNIEVTEGMSGGGLFDGEGNYLGLLIGGSDTGEGVFLSCVNISG